MAWLLLFFSNYLIFLLFLFIPYLWSSGYRLPAFRASLSALLAWLLSTAIKDFFYLPRPYLLNHHSSLLGIWLDGSFPSGHTAIAFAIASSAYLHSHKLGWLMFTCSLLISVSRILGNIHTISDVLAGVLIGFSCTIIAKNFKIRG